jgi:hypothetical protein
VAIEESNPAVHRLGEVPPTEATSTPVARPLLAALWAQLLAAPARSADKPEGRRRADLNRDGQWPAATLVNSEMPS